MKISNIICSLSLLLLLACTTIDDKDYLIDYTPPIPEGADVRKIILEDYTGMRCSNCPKAATKVSVLSEMYKERFIGVSIHAGYFARPINGFDLRTPEGEEYNKHYAITGNPQGIVNRAFYKDKPFYPVDMWDGAVQTVPDKSAFGVDLSVSYNTQNRSCTVNSSITRFNKTENDAIDIMFWVIEDNIITPQIIEDGSAVENYNQRHVFRKSLNGTWGEKAILPQYIAVEQPQMEITYTLPTNFKEKDCSIIALLCNRESKEIIQATEVHIIAN